MNHVKLVPSLLTNRIAKKSMRAGLDARLTCVRAWGQGEEAWGQGEEAWGQGEEAWGEVWARVRLRFGAADLCMQVGVRVVVEVAREVIGVPCVDREPACSNLAAWLVMGPNETCHAY